MNLVFKHPHFQMFGIKVNKKQTKSKQTNILEVVGGGSDTHLPA